MLVSSLRFGNYRTFQRETDFELAPITILTGPNSSGKSSVLKALLLLKESAKRNGLEYLDFAGGGHHLGSFDSVVSHDGESDCLTFGLSLPAVSDTSRGESISSIDTPPSHHVLPTPIANEEGGIADIPEEIRVTLRFTDSRPGLQRVNFEVGTDGSFDRVLSIFLGDAEYEWEHPSEIMNDVCAPADVPSGFVGVWINGPWMLDRMWKRKSVFEEKFEVSWESEAVEQLRAVLSDDVTRAAYPPLRLSEISTLFKGGFDITGGRGSQTQGSGRDTSSGLLQQMLYSFVKQSTDVLVSVLRSEQITHLSALREGVNQIYLEQTTPSSFVRLLRKAVDNRHLLRENQHWLDVFNIGEKIDVRRVAEAGYVVSARRNGHDYPISSLGFGVTQILPLIMYLQLTDASDASQMLLVEEPEANLHPNLQAQLGDLFVDLVQRHRGGETGAMAPYNRNAINMIVETHSEYLVRRLQYLVATNDVRPEDVVIYYLGPDPAAKDYIRKIRMASDGQLSQPFGPGFFDEATNLMVDLYSTPSDGG